MAPAVPVDPMDRADLVVPAVLRLAVLGLVVRAVLVDLDPVDPAVPGLAAPVDLMDPAVPVDLHLVGRDDAGPHGGPGGPQPGGPGRCWASRVGRVVPADRAAPVVRRTRWPGRSRWLLDRAVLAARMGLVTDLVGLVDRPDPVGLVVLGDLADPNTAGLVAPADRHRRRMCSAVSTIVVARSGVARGTHRTASALPITARRRRLGKMGSAGMVDLLPELRRPTGTARLLLGAGTDRRPLAAGIRAGMGRHAT